VLRKRRFIVPGVPQHIVQRGHNKEPCFYTESDYYCYLDNLNRSATSNHCVVHSYCLMTNHVHLLVTPTSSFGVSHFMQDIGRKYVSYINRTYKRSGALWEGRNYNSGTSSLLATRKQRLRAPAGLSRTL